MSLDFSLYYKLDNNDVEIFSNNITHNLVTMAEKAGIYEALWHPYKIKAKKAKDVIEILEKGLKKLKAKPAYYEKFNASNGWGMYEHFVPFVEECLEACKEHSNAKIYSSI